MSYVFIGVGLLAFLLVGLYAFVNADVKRVTGGLKIGAVLLVVAIVLALVAGGRAGLVMMAAAFLVPLVMRWRNARRMAGPGSMGSAGSYRAAPSPGQQSSIDTRFFSMILDHDSGDLDGEIREGRFRGHRLSTLDLPDLLALLAECREDPQSTQVLVAYLDRNHGAEWRDAAAAEDKTAGTGTSGAEQPMSREEAFRILGLEPGADAAAIKAAHHRLMLKFHPDQGGSAWFAARINEARDLLLPN
jgi:hypothetical protein